MISFAQNFEDVILARVFQKLERGFYVDLGASDSTLDSVTRHFYDYGWSGINVEPNPENYETLVRDRVRDVNLNFGVGAKDGHQTFYSISGTGLSTFDAKRGQEYFREFPGSKSIQVPMMSVESLIREIQTQTTTVHFLKVDIEGQEEEVLRGWNFHELAPWVVVVESTKPRTQIPTHQLWEEHLIMAGYQVSYVDGLNRFYLHKSHLQLKEYFAFPPNVFDDFVKYSEHLLTIENSNLKNEMTLMAQEILAMKSSKSWKITAPIRRLVEFFKLLYAKN